LRESPKVGALDGQLSKVEMSAQNSIHFINACAFAQLPRDIVEAHFGEFAVLANGKVESYHATNREALIAASRRFPAGTFSVQRVEPQPVDMGFADCANYPR
jgi:hypothetical protein